MSEVIFTNAQIVTRRRVVRGTLVARGGLIHTVEEGRSSAPGAIDLGGDYLLPGLVEIHTDNLERHFQPRPGVRWPSSRAAMLAHDTQIAGAGITTVLDAVAVGDYSEGPARREMLRAAIAAVRDARNRVLMRAEHRLHLRCEISDPAVAEIFEELADTPFLQLISLMDHTPGQRQWATLDAFRSFYRDRRMSEADIEALLADRLEAQARYAAPNRRLVVDYARQRGIALASHDDATPEHVAESMADGVAIAEFPTTREAAALARANGIAVVMGAPNVVRGGSHSGNVSALELGAEGLLDGLSSDYVPTSLLHGAFLLHQTLGRPLPETVAAVSANPAAMIGLSDRGAIEIGRRADLVHVHLVDDLPVVLAAWRDAARVV